MANPALPINADPMKNMSYTQPKISPLLAPAEAKVTPPGGTLGMAQQQSLGMWDTFKGFGSEVGEFFGFGNEAPQLQFPEQGVSYTPEALKTMELNNNALGLQQQQSLGRWNAVGNVFSGISGLAGAYIGMEQLKLAKDNAKFTKQAYETNLKNQKADFNRQLEERRRRYQERSGTGDAATLQSYMDKHGL